MLFNKDAVPVELAISSLEACIIEGKGSGQIDQYHLLQVLEYIQKSSDAEENRVALIEFHFLALLDGLSSERPLSLERKLARDPKFFHEMIGYCYRSQRAIIEADESTPDDGVKQKIKKVMKAELELSPSDQEPNERQRDLATQAYRLLKIWSIIPGTVKEGTAIDDDRFALWFDTAKTLCVASGHWPVAQLQIGNCLMKVAEYSKEDDGEPAGLKRLEVLLQHPLVAKTVDSATHEKLRQGMTTELFNSRGTHGFSHGKQEADIATRYRMYAGKFDEHRLPRIATSLRGLAETYEHDAEREKNRDPYS
jgi:hypothetical protein